MPKPVSSVILLLQVASVRADPLRGLSAKRERTANIERRALVSILLRAASCHRRPLRTTASCATRAVGSIRRGNGRR